MLSHVRLTLPADLTDPVVDRLVAHAWVTNVTVQRDAVVEPPGDLVEADLAREKASDLFRELQELEVDRLGGIVITRPTGTPFAGATVLEAAAPGHPDDAVIWEAVEAQAYAGALPTVSYHLFLVLAVALAGIAVITDSAILVVGAMVVGPEFSTISAIVAGLVLGRWGLVGRGLRLLVLGFAFAIAVVTLLALVAGLAGVLSAEDLAKPRPNTGFIWHPDLWSFLVALLAGAAGALALAVERSSTMVGVFISVTTVPAAGNLALGLAVQDSGEILGSLAQLGANITGMVVSGALLLAFMRRWWPAVIAGSDRLFGTRSDVGSGAVG